MLIRPFSWFTLVRGEYVRLGTGGPQHDPWWSDDCLAQTQQAGPLGDEVDGYLVPLRVDIFLQAASAGDDGIRRDDNYGQFGDLRKERVPFQGENRLALTVAASGNMVVNSMTAPLS